MNGSSITRKTGSEGPPYDPYHYEELTITRSDGRKVTIHVGLAEWIDYFNGCTTRRFEDSCQILASKFEAVMGISLKTALRIPQQLLARRLNLHRKHDAEWVEGFPGETLLYCKTCGTVIDSCFNVSAVE